MQLSLGMVTVPHAGTPVRATVNTTAPTLPLWVHAYSVYRRESNSGTMYVSLSPTDDRVALTKILAELTDKRPEFNAGIVNQVNTIDMSQLYIDSAVDGGTVIIVALVC